MAKNFADIYNFTGDSIAVEQAWFVKAESTKGQIIAPGATDFLQVLPGGSPQFQQPFETSPQRSGRHNLDIIKKKKELSWSFSTYFNIDETLGSASSAEVDPAVRALWKSMLGHEDVSAGAVYNSSTPPDTTLSIFNNGDKWSQQSAGCFVQSVKMDLPGDGEAKNEWSGAGKQTLLVGVGKSLANNAANTLTLEAGEGYRFPVGSLIMIIKSNGTTRSTDTPTGSARTVQSVAADVLTISGAPLADADGSGLGAPIYVAYYEPSTKTAINNPVTGLVGSMTITGLTNPCFRNASIELANNHELVNYCYGVDSLASPFFVAGSRLTATLTMSMNLNDRIVEFFNKVQAFTAQNVTAVLGSASGRHLSVAMPKVFFPVPAYSVPDSGSIPIEFKGTCYESALDAADEVTVSFI